MTLSVITSWMMSVSSVSACSAHQLLLLLQRSALFLTDRVMHKGETCIAAEYMQNAACNMPGSKWQVHKAQRMMHKTQHTCSMPHTTCTIHHTLCTIHHTPYTMHHAPYTIYHTPYTMHHAPRTTQEHTPRCRKKLVRSITCTHDQPWCLATVGGVFLFFSCSDG